MDENILHSLASQRSQECQLMDLTLGRLAKLHEAEVAILDDLYRADRWRWTPEHGLQVGLPQDLQVRWFSRESVWDLQNRVRPLTLPDGDPDLNAHRRLEKQEYVWLLSQMLHYKLGFALTPVDAAARIATALRTGNVQQPRKLKHRAQKLREEYQAYHNLRNTELQQLGSAVNLQTSLVEDGPEGENGIEDGASDDGTGPAHFSVESGLKRPLESENMRANKEAVALGPFDRDNSINVNGADLYEGETTVTVSATRHSQAQAAMRSNLSNPARRPWVSHFQTLLKAFDSLPSKPRGVPYSEQNGTEKSAQGARPLTSLGRDAPAPSKSKKAASSGVMSERVNTDSTKSFTARPHKPRSSVDALASLENAIQRQIRRRPPALEGADRCPSEEPGTESFQCNVLQKQHKAETPFPRTGANCLAGKNTGPRISEPDTTGLSHSEDTAPCITELEQVPQSRNHPPIYIVIEDSDSEQPPQHYQRDKITSSSRLKRRKPRVKVVNNLGTADPGRSIFSMPRSDVDGDDGSRLFSPQGSSSSVPPRISARFLQTKRSAVNPGNRIKNKIPATVRNSMQNVSSDRGNRRGMQSGDACTSKAHPNAAIDTIPGKDSEAPKATGFEESATDWSPGNLNQEDQENQSMRMIPDGSHQGAEKGARRRGCESSNIYPPRSITGSNTMLSNIGRASSPPKRNLSACAQPLFLQQETRKMGRNETESHYNTRSYKRVRAWKKKPPKKPKCPKQQPRMAETTLAVSDIYAQVDTGRKNIDEVVDELRHSSQTFATSFQTPRKTKRSHSTAFNEVSVSFKRGKGRPNRDNTTYELMKGTTPGAPKSPIPRADDVTIFPRLEYLMGCDENGVPARRAAFRRPTPLTHTIRNQVGEPLPREETPLEELLRCDQERRRRDPKTKANFWGRFPKPSPWRSGKGVWCKPVNSTTMPFRGFGPRRPRTTG
ncbi:hypothetical protein AYL99_08555 [Fonsecaea erecta]|uniref:Uncharacterized protein n=1 Tax=Fonsecaea erecta TaxID=1367422 RepID=A0A178ZDF8_9EURO|nr:hypothetical protein AYL99_08555 [Fonsecaea erecta]OAP57817.1 hypothetical protein AYL99_08555 [Fonsecaea erecta]